MQLYDSSTLSLSRCLNASRCRFHVTEYYNTTVAIIAIIYKAGSICLARPGDDDIEILEDDSGLRTAPSWELPGFNRIRIVYTTLLVMFTNLFPHKFLWYIYRFASQRYFVWTQPIRYHQHLHICFFMVHTTRPHYNAIYCESMASRAMTETHDTRRAQYQSMDLREMSQECWGICTASAP